MIIMLKPNSEEEKIQKLIEQIEKKGLHVQRNNGVDYTVLALIGDTAGYNRSSLEVNEIVHKIIRVQEPFKRANRLFHPHNTIIKIGNHTVGGDEFMVIAGPCSVESEEQIVGVAKQVKASGAQYLRGGAFKPRTSPYSFQGLEEEGLKLLQIAKKETGLPIVSEILSHDKIGLFMDNVDIIQVGARNMQNFQLLKELGKVDKPIMLKRGMVATIEEWLMSAEYIMSEGNPNVILCERGIRTFENFTRNTLDISAIPVVKRLSHLPVIVDPSHAGGKWWLVEPLAKASVVAGADGIVIEVHPNPEEAWSDGGQSLKPKKFDRLMREIEVLARTESKTLLPKKEVKSW
ncbi:MAG: 3-deoxy-7-phosphoheptulonate synthase [Clostridiales bacterium]|nr:3-deoxy-7-phosphoheptulonate synthase [Clostridiales bacterium]